MKKFVSIFFALAIILSGTHFTIASHFCGGKFAASKVSLSGKLASCGMEGIEESCPIPGSHLASHCCYDQQTIIGIVNIFTSPISQLKGNAQNILHGFNLYVNQLLYPITVSKPLYTSFDPTGRFLTSSVNLENICVFRI